MKSVILFFILLSSSITIQADRYNPKFHKHITRKQLVGFVKEAIAFVKIYGKTAALKEFKNKKGLFNRGELYIYAYNMKGIVLSHGQNASLIGKNLIRLKGPNRQFIIREQINIIKKYGKGWLYYYWFHPENNKIARKLGYFEKVDNNWWLGSGKYIK